MSETLFSLENVSVDYPDSGLALDRLDLAIEAGDRVVLLGTNGCGKTTLLKLLDGLVAPSSGVLRFAGEPLDAARLARPEFARDFRRRVALMFQHPEAMLFNPTVAAEIGFGLRHLPEAEARERVRYWADFMRLDTRLMRRRRSCPAARNSACAWRACWRSNRKCCCSTNPPRTSTRARSAG